MSFLDLSEQVIARDLCMQCGACYVACPLDLIKIDSSGEITFLGNSFLDCGSCNACLQSCPGYDPETSVGELQLFDRTRLKEERWIGVYSKLVASRSTNPDILNHSSSGGSATSLLGTAMKHLNLDYVIVAGRDTDEPWKGSPYACKTESELLNFAQSTYQLFPYLWIIKDLLKENPEYKIGLVGLACHIQAIRKLQRLDNYWGNLVRSQVQFTLEIACSSNTLCSGTETLITEVLGVDLSEVKDVKYRHGDHPGNFAVFTKSGEVVSTPFWNEVEHFKNHKCHRCLTCGDWMSGLADLSLCDGDPNIFKSSKHPTDDTQRVKFGLIFVRTALGEHIVDLAAKDGSIEIWEATEFDQTQNLGLQRKLNRRAEWEQSNVTLLPLGPIDNYREDWNATTDDEVISNLSD